MFIKELDMPTDKANTMKIKTIDINAKEWTDKTHGNSYFSAVVTLNYGMKDTKQLKLNFQYGSGDHYVYMAMKELIIRGVINEKRSSNGSYPSMWRYCKENKIILRTSKQTNCKKREL